LQMGRIRLSWSDWAGQIWDNGEPKKLKKGWVACLR